MEQDAGQGTAPGTDGPGDVRPRPTPGGFAYTAADEEKRRGVRRMKTTATGLLLLVALVYVLATWAKNEGVGGCPGIIAAPDEAGMVGAVADHLAELSTALRGALTVLRDADVQAVVGEAITRRANAVEIGPGLGKMLEKVVAD